MKFDRSNKFDLCYYGQVNSLRLKSSVVNTFGGIIYFAGDGSTSIRSYNLIREFNGELQSDNLNVCWYFNASF